MLLLLLLLLIISRLGASFGSHKAHKGDELANSLGGWALSWWFGWEQRGVA